MASFFFTRNLQTNCQFRSPFERRFPGHGLFNESLEIQHYSGPHFHRKLRSGMQLRRTALELLICIGLMLLPGCGAVKSSTPANSTERFAFVVNEFSNSISTFAIDGQTGQLSPKSTVPSGGNNSNVMMVEPSGHFAYVRNVDSISQFAI